VSRWLVTGAGGMLGQDLLAACARDGVAVMGLSKAELDVSVRDSVLATVREIRPAVIVNCAAFTKVDDCEARVDTARAVNGEAVAHLAEAADEVGALLVQVSTDFVFDGSLRRPLQEHDPVGPISEYGRSKLLGEENAGKAARHLVVRTSWLYGRGGWNFVEALRKQVAAGKKQLTVVEDQVGSPTATPDVADALLALVGSGALGTVHFANAGETSWFGYAQEIARLAGWGVEVSPISSAELSRPAPRPEYSVLDTARYEGLTGRHPRPWREPLAEYVSATSDAARG
jgi:dTDP-4-dehydrorhamnose reductase